MKQIGEILLGARAITETVRDQTLAYMKTNRVSFGTAILEMGGIAEEALLRALSVQSGAPPVGAKELQAVPPELIRLVPAKLAEKHTALPFRKVGRTLYLAMAHPRDNPGADEIAFLTGLTVVRHVAITARIVVALDKCYGIPADPRLKALATRLDGGTPEPAEAKEAKAEPAPAPGPAPERISVPAAARLPSGMFRIPLSDGPVDPWKLAPGSPSSAPDDLVVLETVRQAPKKPQVEALDFFPEAGDDDVEPAGEPLEPRPRPQARRVPAPGEATPPAAPAAAAPAPRPGRTARAGGAEPPPPDDLALRLGRVDEKDEVGLAILESLRRKFDTAALFLVRGDRVNGWLARPEPDGDLKEFSVPFSEPSLFSSLRNTSGFFAGPCPDTSANRRMLESLGVRFPAVVGIVPVTMRGKTVLFLLGEAVGGTHAVDVPVLRRHAAMTAISLEILALRNKLATV